MGNPSAPSRQSPKGLRGRGKKRNPLRSGTDEIGFADEIACGDEIRPLTLTGEKGVPAGRIMGVHGRGAPRVRSAQSVRVTNTGAGPANTYQIVKQLLK